MVFFKDLIGLLVKQGHTVDLASNENEWEVPQYYREIGCKVHQISTSRSPISKGNYAAIKELKELIKSEKYDIVHCHTPNASVVTRLACRKLRKTGALKVYYTAHGFHFHKGAPIKNWVPYYYVEKFCSHFTDKLITINQEDYNRAKNKFHAKKVEFVPGVGMDLSKFENVTVDRVEKRREIGVPEDAFLMLSVGELSIRKNHQVIIKALAKLNNPNIHYVIAGDGPKKDYLLSLANSLGVSGQVHLLGLRKDIIELNLASDVFCFPSKTEGMGIAALEAMACERAIVTSNVHGINDYSDNGKTGFKCKPNDVDGFANAILRLYNNPEMRCSMGKYNLDVVKKYDINNILKIMLEIY